MCYRCLTAGSGAIAPPGGQGAAIDAGPEGQGREAVYADPEGRFPLAAEVWEAETGIEPVYRLMRVIGSACGRLGRW